MDFLLSLGELFTLVAYGQLIIEKFNMDGLDQELLDQIFDVMIRDFSKYALQLYTKGSTTLVQQKVCKRMIKRPVVDKKRFSQVWDTYVSVLKEQYEMNP